MFDYIIKLKIKFTLRNPDNLNSYDGPFCFTSAGPETCGINYCQGIYEYFLYF